MKCVNGCLVREEELDDAVQLEGNQLMCCTCFDKLFPRIDFSIRDSKGRFTDRTKKPVMKSAGYANVTSPKVRKI